MKKIWTIIIIAVLLISLFFLIKPSFSGRANDEERVKLDEFAQCLTDEGLVMYGTEWCSYCQKQKELFGRAFNQINYIDCDKNRETCALEGIQGYPTWKINEEVYSGVQSLERLSKLTGCKL